MTELGRPTSAHSLALPGADGGALTLSWGAATDVGRRRDHNEDSYLVESPFFVVADGMGGHLAGDRASDAVVRRLGALRDVFASEDAIQAALVRATSDIERAAGGNAIGAGTTVTGVAIIAAGGVPAALVFNVGDSRTYRVENGAMRRVTVDHSVVQEMVDAGLLRAEDAESHPDSNVITRAVGFGETPEPDFWTLPLHAGDRYIICSDGLTKEIGDVGISRIAAKVDDPQQLAERLVGDAIVAGGRDNVTVVVLQVDAAPHADDVEDTLPRHRSA
ncbi:MULTISPECIES: PP2C family serine/threonine-protein phosphatase [unclassified Curtobacterium]|uniref:PP2C family protein-serine/threonine phosphatase n=1 Tax=unclassified Curtobacterium TaxID=257496 RepID=UPI000DA7548C|nr:MULTISPECIES: protein phosphatase 2C domain-containing protein [unclassified Curtobacterium]PZE28856.1 serine/threonine-protein phosphatase [Curtobacterium sp. MCBD17_028]PZE77208.1 serine/threonine-protein phosphatase [Curtobacterium sp. MCBD17_019]PZF59110.1 serine/threonine-protein phosphatase [Curtobacterium sp. MCBD17_034]PZF65238.1 serine/threonine-protein phosphatase [Curtobacterium sp. MCBD17_013]PZM34347.1 serine/threonine-protein phosphatase [Curtobacterium sp. MCBD17_031]